MCQSQAIGLHNPQGGFACSHPGFHCNRSVGCGVLRVSALKQAALVAPGFATILGLDILASLPSLAFRYTQDESKVGNYLLYLDPR
jgi:hypothetical protein